MTVYLEGDVQRKDTPRDPSPTHNPPTRQPECDVFPCDIALSVPVMVVDVLSNYTVPGVLAGFTPGEVAIRVREALSEERIVAVQLKSFSFEGQVLYCQSSGAELEAHVSINDVDRTGLRKTPRFPVTVPASCCHRMDRPLRLPSATSLAMAWELSRPVRWKPAKPWQSLAGRLSCS